VQVPPKSSRWCLVGVAPSRMTVSLSDPGKRQDGLERVFRRRGEFQTHISAWRSPFCCVLCRQFPLSRSPRSRRVCRLAHLHNGGAGTESRAGRTRLRIRAESLAPRNSLHLQPTQRPRRVDRETGDGRAGSFLGPALWCRRKRQRVPLAKAPKPKRNITMGCPSVSQAECLRRTTSLIVPEREAEPAGRAMPGSLR
jgi:hypothetical protein